jgi:hypothetical protein
VTGTATVADGQVTHASFHIGLGSIAVNGITRPVTVTLTARRDGTSSETAGSMPVTFSEFRIKEPGGYGFLGSLAGAGTAEFLLVLRP